MQILCVVMAFSLTSCEIDNERYVLGNGNTTTSTNSTDEENSSITYLAMRYNNQGNNFLNFEGHNFEITPNKIKQWDYNTSGSWTSYYDTSLVVTINIDGHYIESCGSTVLFKDSRLNK